MVPTVNETDNFVNAVETFENTLLAFTCDIVYIIASLHGGKIGAKLGQNWGQNVWYL